jgi:predicted adenylyl cyclase CyaB
MIGNLVNNLLLSIVRQILLAIVSWSEDKGHLEIERKFSLAEIPVATVIERLKEEGFYLSGTLTDTDWFIPSRVKGEMLRLREEHKNGTVNHILTIKTWHDTTDGGKEREEKEHKIRSVTFFFLLYLGKFATSFKLLSFKKIRDIYVGDLEGNKAIVALDEASGLGEFSGRYLEIEVTTPKEAPTKSVQTAILGLASRIATTAPEVRRSYRELLERSLCLCP